jgi:hypothetical protein
MIPTFLEQHYASETTVVEVPEVYRRGTTFKIPIAAISVIPPE